MSGAVDHASLNAQLAERCRAVSNMALSVPDWFRANPAVSRDELPAVDREFRRAAATANRLALAAERQMCVSVFGPSQSGKSYLISALARREHNPVRVLFDGESVDFVEQINPPGGKESTGLVTRFTVRPVAGLPGMPVVLRLLTQSDVIRIVANGYLEDVKRDAVLPPSSNQITALMQDMQRRAQGGRAAGGLADGDVFELRDYFEKYFRTHPAVTALGSGFWPEAATIAPALEPADRAKLFAPLWGQVPQLTALCGRLLAALAELGNPADACCGLDSLLPRTNSIIDVNQLNGLGDPNAATVKVVSRSGGRADLPRPVVAALVSELRLTLAEQPYDFFDHTDLLDFPGARARENIADPAQFLAEPDKLSKLFLRGKVAYLYQQYVAEQELTAMLLCIKDGPQEVRTLPGMVMEWIASTHGPTAKDREQVDCGLFLVLTMFDMEFAEKRGGEASWATRLENALYTFLCLEFDWHLEWTRRVPFKNTFWLRNPNFIAKALLDYDANRREVAVREPERIAQLKQDYLATDLIQRHFADPGRAWDEAFRLNDGGVTYLAGQLRPLCNPEVKRRQVAERLRRLADELKHRLEPYHVSSDVETEQRKRKAEALAVLDRVQPLGEEQRFGLLLRHLQLPSGSLQGLFYNVQAKAPLGRRVSGRDVQDALKPWGTSSTAVGESDRPVDLPDMFAHAGLQEWTQRLHNFAARADLEAAFGLKREEATTLVQVLTDAAHRLKLRSAMAARIDKYYFAGGDAWDRVRMPTLLVEEMINDFVTNLGFGAIATGERPTARHPGRGEVAIFCAPEAADAIPALAEVRAAYETNYLIDWCVGFMNVAVANASTGPGGTFDMAANERLGRMIAALKDI